jgi:hypothetical protein
MPEGQLVILYLSPSEESMGCFLDSFTYIILAFWLLESKEKGSFVFRKIILGGCLGSI